MALEMLHDVSRVHGTDEQMDMPTIETTTHARGRSHSCTHEGVFVGIVADKATLDSVNFVL